VGHHDRRPRVDLQLHRYGGYGQVHCCEQANGVYKIAVTPASQEIGTGAMGTATFKVTDVFGNSVTTTLADGPGAVSIAAYEDVLLAGFATSGT
jgi:hypothetical protein